MLFELLEFCHSTQLKTLHLLCISLSLADGALKGCGFHFFGCAVFLVSWFEFVFVFVLFFLAFSKRTHLCLYFC
uniref:Uncharacterized protein n=1 Tax=Balaenoptera musculus TaxID=9771 RepID=A0A8C0D406_BALMU